MMEKFTFYAVAFILTCAGLAQGDRSWQNANLDFINFESNNKRYPSQPQPLPQNPGIDPLKLDRPTSTTSKTPIQNQFNPKAQPIPNQPAPKQPAPNQPAPKQPTSNQPLPNQPAPKQPQPNQPNVPPAPTNTATTGTTPKPGTTGVNVRQMVKDYDGKTTGTTTTLRPNNNNRNNFPSLPKVGGGPQTPTGTGPSWASIAAGGKGPASTNTAGGNVPNTPGSPNRNVPNTPTSSTRNPNVPGSPTGNIPNVPGSPTGQKNPLQYPTLAPPLRTTQKTNAAQTTTHPLIATDKELGEISEALLSKDVNNPSKYLTVNIQKKTSSFAKDDLAPEPLFTVQPAVWNIPTVAAMKALLDNYEQDTTVNEYVTPQEKNEENAFLDAVMATSVMRHLMTFLKEKGVVTPDPKQQRDLLKQTWFNMYSRGGGKIGSSGFEHIFVSEIKNNEISGLHNWLYFYLEEMANRANYLGHLKAVNFDNNKGSVLKLHFTLKGIDKPVNSMFVGTSPELEMALYSLCFYTRPDQACPITLGGQTLNLRTHTFRYRSKNMIGSAFPEI